MENSSVDKNMTNKNCKNTERFSKHFLMTTADVCDYVSCKCNFFSSDAKLTAEEIGDGNINYVFRVIDEVSGKSLVVKQADKLLRSSGRPLDLHRNKIEAEILKIESELSPSKVPEIYFYDEVMCALCMEDISAYKNLRTEMMAGKTFPKFANDISDFIADTLLPTTDLVISRSDKKKRVQLFTNIELCDITEDLVLTEPYYDYKKRNINTNGNENFVAEHLYGDEDLKAEVGALRNNFMNNAQSLIHGDLHSGSIFINENGLKVIDPEFAFYGPMGYDIGNVIGNMFFALARAKASASEKSSVSGGDNGTANASSTSQFISWAENAIVQIADLTREKLTKKFDEIVAFPLYNKKFRDSYINDVMADSFGYAGTEIIRRTVGDSKVKELSSMENSPEKIALERALILCGIKLIKERKTLKKGEEVLQTFTL